MRIIYTRAIDKRLCVINGAPKADLDKFFHDNFGRAMTDAEYKRHIWESSVPKDAVDPIEIAQDYELPDREFRDAWCQAKDTVNYDLEKARAIQLEKIRTTRVAYLDALDVEFILALENGDTAAQKAIATKKQALRDITNSLKNAILTSIEEVKKAFPIELKG